MQVNVETMDGQKREFLGIVYVDVNELFVSLKNIFGVTTMISTSKILVIEKIKNLNEGEQN